MQAYLKLIETRDVMKLIAIQATTPTQLAALMAILRFKEETSAELIGFREALRNHIQSVNTPMPHLVDVGLPYDTRSKSPSLILAAVCIAAACGIRVALHGRAGQNTPPPLGVGIGDILQQPGFSPFLSLEQAQQLLEDETVGFAYVDSSQFAPALECLNSVRLDYGMRSFLNTIEKLLNPFNASNTVIGIFHGTVQNRVAEVAHGSGYQRGLVIQGPEGAIDILPGRRSPIAEVTPNGSIVEWQIDPAQFDGWHKLDNEPTHLTARSNAELTEQILLPVKGSLETYQRGALMTAALLLYAAGKAAAYAKNWHYPKIAS